MQSRTLTAALAGTILALGMTTAQAQTNPAPADAPTNAPKAATDAMPADGNAEGAKPKARQKKSHHAKSSSKSGDRAAPVRVIRRARPSKASSRSVQRTTHEETRHASPIFDATAGGPNGIRSAENSGTRATPCAA